jgi:hypothetical protein
MRWSEARAFCKVFQPSCLPRGNEMGLKRELDRLKQSSTAADSDDELLRAVVQLYGKAHALFYPFRWTTAQNMDRIAAHPEEILSEVVFLND